jgi:hypothetical protein
MATPAQMKASAEAMMQELIGRAGTEFQGMPYEELSKYPGIEPMALARRGVVEGKIPPKNWKALLKGSAGKGAIGSALLFMALQKAVKDASAISSTALQTSAIRGQTANMSAEDFLYQAMMPDVQARSQMAREALMNQLGGVHGPSLASGESFVG